jgi:hypothetical protein
VPNELIAEPLDDVEELLARSNVEPRSPERRFANYLCFAKTLSKTSRGGEHAAVLSIPQIEL